MNGTVENYDQKFCYLFKMNEFMKEDHQVEM